MRELILEAVSLAEDASGYEEFRDRYLERFAQRIACDSRETVPAAFALTAMASGDVRRGVELAANFGRDTDTIATMTGALCGAVGGRDAIPEAWIGALGPAAMLDAQDLAGRLAELARTKVAERERLSHTVPGLTDG
jgi:ADP-ribosylglycohydrolase